jgi:hypothetical protein
MSLLGDLGPWRVTAQLDAAPIAANFHMLDDRFTRVAERLSGDHFALTVQLNPSINNASQSQKMSGANC